MPLVVPVPIAGLPIPPTTTDAANFDTRADAFNAALKVSFQPGANALADNVYTNAAYAHERAQAAQSAAGEAGGFSAAADANATLAAAAAGASRWVAGAAYLEGVLVWSPANRRVYRRAVAGGGVTDPSLDAANWQPLGQPLAAAVVSGAVNAALGNWFTTTVAANTTLSLLNPPAAPGYYIGTLEVTHTGGNILLPAGGYWAGGSSPTFTTGRKHLITVVTTNAGVTTRWSALNNYLG